MKLAILTAIIFITAEFIVYGSITTGWGSFALLMASCVISLCVMVVQWAMTKVKEGEEYRKSLFNRN